jgi:hypothetical protein
MVDFKVQILSWYLPDENDRTCEKICWNSCGSLDIQTRYLLDTTHALLLTPTHSVTVMHVLLYIFWT